MDHNSGLWIATSDGVNFYDSDKEIFEHYQYHNSATDGLSDSDVISIDVDSQNLIWLGTYSNGVNILDPNQEQFERLLTKTDAS